jgi:hypothetical protein
MSNFHREWDDLYDDEKQSYLFPLADVFNRFNPEISTLLIELTDYLKGKMIKNNDTFENIEIFSLGFSNDGDCYLWWIAERIEENSPIITFFVEILLIDEKHVLIQTGNAGGPDEKAARTIRHFKALDVPRHYVGIKVPLSINAIKRTLTMFFKADSNIYLSLEM